MNIEKKFNEVIYEWVKENFGESEADDPSWDIKALAKYLSEQYYKIREEEEFENIKEDVKFVAEQDDIELTPKQLSAIADEYRYSESYCEADTDAIKWFIERELDKGE